MFKDNMGDILEEARKYANADYIDSDNEFGVKFIYFWTDFYKNYQGNCDKLFDYFKSINVGLELTGNIRKLLPTQLKGHTYIIDPRELPLKQDKFYDARVNELANSIEGVAHSASIFGNGMHDDVIDIYKKYRTNKKPKTVIKTDSPSIYNAINSANSNNVFDDRYNAFLTFYKYGTDFSKFTNYCEQNNIGLRITDEFKRSTPKGHFTRRVKYIIDPCDVGVKEDMYYLSRVRQFEHYLLKIFEKEETDLSYRYYHDQFVIDWYNKMKKKT